MIQPRGFRGGQDEIERGHDHVTELGNGGETFGIVGGFAEDQSSPGSVAIPAGRRPTASANSSLREALLSPINKASQTPGSSGVLATRRSRIGKARSGRLSRDQCEGKRDRRMFFLGMSSDNRLEDVDDREGEERLDVLPEEFQENLNPVARVGFEGKQGRPQFFGRRLGGFRHNKSRAKPNPLRRPTDRLEARRSMNFRPVRGDEATSTPCPDSTRPGHGRQGRSTGPSPGVRVPARVFGRPVPARPGPSGGLPGRGAGGP